MNIGIRQRMLTLLFSGLLVTLVLIGTYRYYTEKRDIMNTALLHGEQSGKLAAELAAPYLLTSDFNGLRFLADAVLQASDVQELTIVDREGRRLVHASKPVLAEQRMLVGPLTVASDAGKLGEVSIAVYPADLESKLWSHVVMNALVELLFLFMLLAPFLIISVTRTIISPVKEIGNTFKDMIDRKDFTRRAAVLRKDEIGDLAMGVNYLVERFEQFIINMGGISSRINALNPMLAADALEVRKSAETEDKAVTGVFSAVATMDSSIRSVAESADSLATSAEQAMSTILQMNASNMEVARHTGDLASSVEKVTASVTEMTGSIREVAGHIENLSSVAEESSASASQIEATVREVERAAKESTRLSQQVSREAKDIGVRSIHETMSAIDTIKDAVGRYSEVVTRLGNRSEEIGKIVGVIVEVTERTNLLALNASILAAQAGEHGKGFSVVAEEIKALADRTAASAQDIGKLITAVQKEAKEAVATMSDSTAAVEEGVLRSREAGAALEKILASSSRSAEMATMIERAMTEQARGVNEVSGSVANVKRMSEQIAGVTQAQSKGTEAILSAAESMREIARQVRTALDEQGRGGKQIATAAENVAMRADSIAAGTKEQRRSIAHIREAVEQIQDMPRKNVKRVEGMAAALKVLGEQAALLDQELVTMKVGKDFRAGAEGTLKMGVIPLDAPAEMYRRFTPLADYLSRVVGRRVELSLATDFAQTLSDLERGATDLAFLTPATYIDAQKKFGARLLVKALRKGEPYTRAVIVARANGAIARLRDIKGLRFAFGDRLSTASYLIPRAMLAEAGIGLDDLREYGFLGHHDDVAKAVLAGAYDAGGLREATAKRFEGQGLAIIQNSMEIPEFNICAAKGMDNRLAELTRTALIALDHTDEEQARILAMVDPDYTGFMAAVDSDYDGIRRVRESMQEAGPTA